MKFESSTKTAVFEKKPRIEKDYYVGKLTEVKQKSDRNGNPILSSKYGGEQVVMLYQIFERVKVEEGKYSIGKPITYETGGKGQATVTNDLIIASVRNSTYPDGKGGQRTAFTPKAGITSDFMALGWKGPPEKIETEDYVGKFVEVNIDDADFEREVDGKKESYKASVIRSISAWEGEVVGEEKSSPSKKVEEPLEVTVKEQNGKQTEVVVKKIKELMSLMNKGHLSAEGYGTAIESMRAGNEEVVNAALEVIKKEEEKK